MLPEVNLKPYPVQLATRKPIAIKSCWAALRAKMLISKGSKRAAPNDARDPSSLRRLGDFGGVDRCSGRRETNANADEKTTDHEHCDVSLRLG